MNRVRPAWRPGRQSSCVLQRPAFPKPEPTVPRFALSLFAAGPAGLAVLLLLALLAMPADEARADSGHPGEGYPLYIAARYGDLAAVIHLLGSAHGIDVNAKAVGSGFVVFALNGRRPLHAAANSGHAIVVATLLAAGADVNAEDDAGYAPLHSAARFGHAIVVATLLAAGADVNAKTNKRNLHSTPLHSAAIGGRAHIVSLLLAAGAEVDAKTTNGDTPLHRSIWYGGQTSVVSVLLAAGADVNAKNNGGETPLRATCHSDRCPAWPDFAAHRAALIAAGGHWGEACAEPLAVNRAHYSPPCLCESESLNAGTAGCPTPSRSACAGLNPPRLYDSDADMCGDLFYPCHDSAYRRLDNSGCMCPTGTWAHGDPSGGEWVGTRKSIPATAICHADHAPLAHDPDGWTVAIETNNPTLVAHFIADHGQDPDVDDALHLAARHSALGIVKLLLARGANPDATDSDGDTPLHEAVQLSDTPDNVALISLLLDKGADPNIRNDHGWRPLDLAYDGGEAQTWQARRGIMAALITGGADWASECTGGKIPDEHYRPPEVADCKCPNHLAVDNNGVCECPAETHAQVNGRCLPKDSAQADEEIQKMRAELKNLRAALADLNLQLSLAADGPPEMLEEVAKQAEVAARGIARRRDNFLALARAGLAEADDAGPAPALALSDTEATCRMLDGEVQTHSRTGAKICSGIDHNDTFCIVGSASAFPCMGFFRHVRLCNDRFNRPALDPWHCGKICSEGLRARGAKCGPD